jgi:hypothetical protein
VIFWWKPRPEMAKDTYPTALANTGYEVSLMRVAPGQEPQVAKQLRQAIAKYSPSHNPPVCLLKLFGRYDICAIYETENFRGAPSKAGPIAGIRGGVKIHAFRWRPPGARRQLAIQHAKGSVYGLLFFRFNERLLAEHGAFIEHLFAQYWHDRKLKGITLDVLGTTGWAELLFLLRGHKFGEVTQALSEISGLFLKPPRATRQIIPTKTFSLIGLDFDLTLPAKRSLLVQELDEPFRRGRGVFPLLNVTCFAGSMGPIYRRAVATIGPGVVTFGGSDFLFTPKRRSWTWGDFISRVLNLRHGLSNDLYSTSISILRVERQHADIPLLPPRRRPLEMASPLRDALPTWGTTIEERVTNIYFGVSNLLQDPLIGHCFEDLRPMLTEDLPIFLTTQSPKKDSNLRFLRSLIAVIDHAAQERAHGAFLSLEQMEGSLSPTKGGIQRILTAASLIPSQLLAYTKKPWYGFLIAGYQNRIFSSWYEVVNLPVEYLFKPEKWCGLCHETGHVLLYDKQYFDIDAPEVAKIIIQAAQSPTDSYMFKLWKDLATEVWADMFDLYFCYGTTLDCYLKNIWELLPKNNGTVQTRHFIRYFIIHQYHKYFLARPNTSFPRQIHVERDVQEFVDRLRDLKLEVNLPLGVHDEAANVFHQLQELVRMYHARFRRICAPKNLERDFSSRRFQRQLDTVLSGAVSLDPITSPVSFILALKNHQRHLTLGSRLAAILSLWHTATKIPNHNR